MSLFENAYIKQFSRFTLLLAAFLMCCIPQTAAAEAPKPQPQTVKPVNITKQFDELLNERMELKAKEAELKLLEKKLNEQLIRQEAMLLKIKKETALLNRTSDVRVKRLIRIYSSMDAKSAARLIENLETNQAVEVLAGMKGELSGPILANMEKQKASRMIRLLASYKGPGNLNK